jgi:hypothetical protein
LRNLRKSGELSFDKVGDIGRFAMASKDGNKPGGGSGSGRAPILPLQLPSNIARLPSADRREKLRILEALLFAAAEAPRTMSSCFWTNCRASIQAAASI